MFNFSVRMRSIRISFLLLCALLYTVQMGAVVKGDRFTTKAAQNPGYAGLKFEVTSLQDAWGQKNNVKFVGTTNAGAVTIPATVKDSANVVWNVTAIGSSSDVPNATSVTIPNSVTRIEGTALSGSKMTQVNLPKSVTDITAGAFAFCKGLTTINVDPANTKYSSSDGILYDKDGANKWLNTYPQAKAGTTFSIPSDVYGVRPNAFQQSQNVENINVPASVKELPTTGEYTGFTSALKLKNITVDSSNPNFQSRDGVVFSKDGKNLVAYPNKKEGKPYVVPTDLGVEKILGGAFSKCEGIETIKLPASLKTVGKNSFKDCIHLTTVEVPKAVTSIEDGAFAGSYHLSAINVEAGNSVYKSDNGVVYTADGKTLVSYPAGKIGEYTTLPSTETIRKEAFKSAVGITKLTISKGVKKIENDAFQYTSALKELAFEQPSTLKEIGTWCFVNSALEKLEIPASLEKLGDAAFYGASKLKTVTVADGSKMTSIGSYAFQGCGSLTSFDFLGSSVLKEIKNSAFAGDKKITTFTFPASVQTLETGVFNGCTALEHVHFDPNAVITKIGAGAFQNAGLLDIEIPKSVTTIEQSAFNSCQKLKVINLPAATTNVSPQAFQFCGSLNAIHADKANPQYSSVDGFLLSKDKKQLVVFPAGKASTYYTMIPPTVEEIGPYAFYYIQKLENVTLPEKLKKIDAHAFDMCKKLNTIAFLGLTPVPAADVDNTAFYAANIDKTKISLNVRKDALAAYHANSFWGSGFKTLNVSFFKDPNGFGNTEYFPLSEKAVMIVDVQSDVHTYVVPKKVKNPNDNKDYEVRLWGDYAMTKSNVNIKEVVFNNQLDYIGIDAFKRQDGTTTIESAFFTTVLPAKDMSSTKWELKDQNKAEFTPALKKIYVKKSAVNNYKTATGWTDYANSVDYKIPGLALTHKYGTFAREFDVDLSVYFTENNRVHGLPAAFVASASGVMPGAGDYGQAGAGHNSYRIKMESIDKHGGPTTGEFPYTYVPKFTGVMLKDMTEEALPADFYYAIGEKDNVDYTISGNKFIGTTVKQVPIHKNGDPIFVVSASKGILVKPKNDPFNMPLHRAYAKLAGVPASARVVFVFDDGDEIGDEGNTTGIDTVTTNTTDGAYYTIDGRRVENPQSGLYIHNGKKVIVK